MSAGGGTAASPHGGTLAELRRLYVDEQLGAPAIARRIGVSRSTVYRRLELLGIETRPGGRRPGDASIATPEMDAEIRELYSDDDGQGLTMAEIGRRLHVSEDLVRLRLIAMRVPRRSRGRRAGVTQLLGDDELQRTAALYHQHGLVETCRRLGLRDHTVRCRLRRAGIEPTRRYVPEGSR